MLITYPQRWHCKPHRRRIHLSLGQSDRRPNNDICNGTRYSNIKSLLRRRGNEQSSNQIKYEVEDEVLIHVKSYNSIRFIYNGIQGIKCIIVINIDIVMMHYDVLSLGDESILKY
ncbi:hypothetical protein GQX74_008284 [Glossina fuscipes]|nr:hypothetical protein GQX74_008284 [Glossina fuscipes]